jgi:hypothetical protein
MPLSNADNPTADKPEPKATADEPKATAADKPEPKAKAPELAKASSTGDAGVQNLLARRMIAESVGHDTVVAEIDAELAELGFRV